MPERLASDLPVSESRLWFGLLGSPIAWLIHLVVVYTLAEVTCVADSFNFTVLGLDGGVSLILIVTLLTLVLAVAAGVVAYGSDRRLRRQEREHESFNDRGVSGQMARWGMHLTVLFVFIIGVETIPVFFYLQPCS